MCTDLQNCSSLFLFCLKSQWSTYFDAIFHLHQFRFLDYYNVNLLVFQSVYLLRQIMLLNSLLQKTNIIRCDKSNESSTGFVIFMINDIYHFDFFTSWLI